MHQCIRAVKSGDRVTQTWQLHSVVHIARIGLHSQIAANKPQKKNSMSQETQGTDIRPVEIPSFSPHFIFLDQTSM